MADPVLNLQLAMLSEVLVSSSVIRVRADGVDGSFCLLPRHRDWIAPLAEGVLEWTDPAGTEHYAAHGSGLLVKAGQDVLVTVRVAALGDDLTGLPQQFEETQAKASERVERARQALVRLETSLVRRFVDYREGRRV